MFPYAEQLKVHAAGAAPTSKATDIANSAVRLTIRMRYLPTRRLFSGCRETLPAQAQRAAHGGLAALGGGASVAAGLLTPELPSTMVTISVDFLNRRMRTLQFRLDDGRFVK